MLANGHRLLDQEIEILGKLRSETVGLQDAKNFVTGNVGDLTDTVGITEKDTDLGGGEALFGELANMLVHLLGGELEPGRRTALVGDGAAANTLSYKSEAT